MLWLLLTASTAYYLAALLASLRPSSQRLPSPGRLPAVSILKPVRGRGPEFYSCIRSHAAQDYPQFEILFAVRDPDDAAISEIRRLGAEFPHLHIELFITDIDFGHNAKVNSLERLRREARHEAVVVGDSDIRVGPDYLRRVVAPLSDPDVGLVTCPYRGVHGGALPSLLEALWISTDFQVSVRVARLLGIRFALGATMAFRRSDLDRSGGFAPLSSYLADDYLLGKSISDLGLRITLADYPVETLLPKDSWAASWRHRIRWGRTLRVCRPAGYLGLLITFAIPLAAAAVVIQPATWRLALACVFLRFVTAALVGGRLLRDPIVSRYFFLIPVSDVWSFILWIGSLAGRQVIWHGDKFHLAADGTLHPGK